MNNYDIADRFGILQSLVSTIFNTWLNLFHVQFYL